MTADLTGSARPRQQHRPLVQLWRRQGRTLAPHLADPHAELMSLLWGPRFDRDHAWHLLAHCEAHEQTTGDPLPPTLHFAVQQAASLFDQLPAPHQQRLRRLILRHHAWSPQAVHWGTMPHAAHPAH